MATRFWKGLLVTAALIAFGQRGSAQRSTGTASQSAAQAAFDYRGGLISPPLNRPKFILTDTAGAPFDFRASTQGKLTLLFFGYTHCPDMCPMQMSVIARALQKVPAGVADRVTVVFATTDPERDTPQVIRTWLDHFDRRFIGLTGSQSAVVAAQVAAQLPPAQKSAVRPDGSYDVGHAAFALAYTRDNLAHVLYPVGVTVDDLAHDLTQLVAEDWTRH
jgi:protein SCO1/2